VSSSVHVKRTSPARAQRMGDIREVHKKIVPLTSFQIGTVNGTNCSLDDTLPANKKNTMNHHHHHHHQQQQHQQQQGNQEREEVFSSSSTQYDGHAKETSLRTEAEAWDTNQIHVARPEDIPRIDVSDYLLLDDDDNDNDVKEKAIESIVEQLRYACTHVGFYYLTGHGISDDQMKRIFAAVQEFYNLPMKSKEALRMDRPEFSIGGVGYLPLHHRKLPTRNRGNVNEAFVIKRQSGRTKIDLQDNQWPGEDVLPGFQEIVTSYVDTMERLALRLLLLYARTLGVDSHYFDPAFTSPMYRLRMTKYPPVSTTTDNEANDQYGISPHVDTSFLTILAQDSEGLVIYSEQRRCWLRAPMVEGAFIVNSGELLRQWTNDTFISVKHFANNNDNNNNRDGSHNPPRYSIPFFFNANADYRMHCIPTCCNDSNPPKYPPFSYEESQAIAQGE